MNAQIRIYPDKEMEAADMAEGLHAALPESCVIQGCHLTLSSGNVHVSSGRISIKGRVAYVEAGDIVPYTVSSTDTGASVCAVCDLSSAENPFQLRILSSTEYSDIAATQAGFVLNNEGDTFNSSNGIALLKMADVTISPGTGVSKLTVTASGKPRHSKNYIDEGDAKVQTSVNNLRNKENSHYQRLMKWKDHLVQRVHSSKKFRTWNITIPHCVINDGQVKTFDAPVTYGVVETYTNGKNVSTYTYKNTTYKETTYTYKDEYDNNKTVDTGVRSSIKTFAAYGPQFLTPIGIVQMSISNSDNGGKNRQRCRILGYGFGDKKVNVTLAMDPDVTIKDKNNNELYKTEYKQAIVDITLKVLYVQEE